MLLFILCCFCARIFVHCISKHLMLLFIILDSWARSFRFSISKHLMLLFIAAVEMQRSYNNDFKTSYVIVYLRRGVMVTSITWISKHLMLLFIGFSWTGRSPVWISKHLMLLFIWDDEQVVYYVQEFQNILCYCLSLAFPRFLVSPLPFFPLYFLYFSIFYQPTPLSWTALLIIP